MMQIVMIWIVVITHMLKTKIKIKNMFMFKLKNLTTRTLHNQIKINNIIEIFDLMA